MLNTKQRRRRGQRGQGKNLSLRNMVLNNEMGSPVRANNTLQGVAQGTMSPVPYGSMTKDIVTKFAFKTFTTLTSDANGQFIHRLSLRNLQRAVDGSGTYEDAVNMSNAYDMYRPELLQVETHFIPSIGGFGAPAILTYMDVDDPDATAPATTYLLANAYKNRIMFDPRYKEVFSWKIPRLESGTNPGVATTGPVVIQEGGYLDFQAPPVDGIVGFFGTGFAANQAILNVSVTMNCTLRAQR